MTQYNEGYGKTVNTILLENSPVNQPSFSDRRDSSSKRKPHLAQSLFRKFWRYVERGPENECWVWQGAVNGHGYGHIGTAHNLEWELPATLGAHRAAWFLMRGPVPDGLTLDHLCRNRLCVNPSHLQPVTRGENVLRGIAPPAINARKSHCPNGHPFDRLDGKYRRCGDCRRAQARSAYKRRTAGSAESS